MCKSKCFKSVILQDTDRILVDNSDNGKEQSIFNVGVIGKGSVPIKQGKFYEFELNLFLKNLVSYSKLYFSMLGNKEMAENIAYIAMSRLIYDPYADGDAVAVDCYSFDKTLINREDENVGNGFLTIKGSFKSNGNGIITPAISFDGMSGEDKVMAGSRFILKEIKTTSDIL